MSRPMTSTAILDVIDLTDSPPPDNETQGVPKTADYSPNQDPEKNTTRELSIVLKSRGVAEVDTDPRSRTIFLALLHCLPVNP